MNRNIKKSQRGRRASSNIESHGAAMDYSYRALQSKGRRRLNTTLQGGPSVARRKQRENISDIGVPTERGYFTNAFYNPATLTWKSRTPRQDPVVLKDTGVQAEEPVIVKKNAKISAKPRTSNKGFQIYIEEEKIAPLEIEHEEDEEDEEDEPPGQSGGSWHDVKYTKRHLRKISRAVTPIGPFLKLQREHELERKHHLKDIKESQEQLENKMESVIAMADGSLSKNEAILSAVLECSNKVEPCKGPHIDTETIMEIPMLIDNTRDSITEYLEGLVRISSSIQSQLDHYTSSLKDLRKEQHTLILNVEKEAKARQEAEANKKDHSDKKCTPNPFFEAKECKCKELRAKNPNGSSTRCQNCRNNFNGAQFLKNNNFPRDTIIVNRIGKILECISNDASERLSVHASKLRKEVKDWDEDKRSALLTSLFDMSMLKNSQKCSSILFKYVSEAGKMKSKMNTLGKLLNGAVALKKKHTLANLLNGLPDEEKHDLINTAVARPGAERKTYSIFECIRQTDCETFEYLICNGAVLDVTEEDKGIVHEIIFMSGKRSHKLFLHEEVMLKFLQILYAKVGIWWIKRESLEDVDENDVTCQEEGISHLMSMKNKDNLNALQYAAKIGSPGIVKAIVDHHPYKFITDNVSFGHYCGKTAYIVDEIEPKVYAKRNSSILDIIVNREDVGNDIVRLQPFKTMLSDKWYRYRIFYWVWFLAFLLYISVFSACAVGRNAGATTLAQNYSRPGDYYRLSGELLCLICLPMFFYGEYSDYQRSGWLWSWTIDRSTSFRLANFSFALCVILVAILRCAASPYEDIFLCFAVLISWMMGSQFLVPLSRSTGMFPVVYFRVLKEDFLKCYIWIFVFVFLGSTIATYCAYQAADPPVSEMPNDSFFLSSLNMVLLTFGFQESEYVTKARLQTLGVILFIVYVLLGNVLLMNLFIAMVNDTYNETKTEHNDTWVKIKSYFGMLMDRRLPVAVRIPFNGSSHIRTKSMGHSLIRTIKLYTATRLIYTRKARLGFADEVESQKIIIFP